MARLGDEKLAAAVWTANAGEAFTQVTALQKGLNGFADDRTPEAIAFLVAFVISGRKLLEVGLDDPPQARSARISRAVKGPGFQARCAHGGCGSPSVPRRPAVRPDFHERLGSTSP